MAEPDIGQFYPGLPGNQSDTTSTTPANNLAPGSNVATPAAPSVGQFFPGLPGNPSDNGPTGPTGPASSSGPTGGTGKKGPTGAKGKSAKGPTGATGATGAAKGINQINNSEDWAHAVLGAGQWPDTPDNVTFLMAFAQIEGGNWNNTAAYNVLGTTIPYGQSATMPGGNVAGVKAYTSWDEGVGATVQMLKQDNMKGIADLLATGKAASQYTESGPAAIAIRDQWDPGGPDYTSLYNAIHQKGGPTLLDANTYGKDAATSNAYSGATVGPGPTTSTTGTGGVPGDSTKTTGLSDQSPAVPGMKQMPQLLAYIKKNFPSYAWILDMTGPEGDQVKTVLEQAVANQDSTAQIQARITGTKWWQDTSTALKNFQQAQALNPSDFAFNKPGSLAQSMYSKINLAALSYGLKLPSGTIQNLALEALMYNWQANDIQANIGAVARTGTGEVFDPTYLTQEATTPQLYAMKGAEANWGTDAQSAAEKVRQQAAVQGARLSDAEIAGLTRDQFMFNWDQGTLRAHITALTTPGNSQFSPDYLAGQLNNPQWYTPPTQAGQPGGRLWHAMWQNVQDIAANDNQAVLTPAEHRAITQWALTHIGSDTANPEQLIRDQIGSLAGQHAGQYSANWITTQIAARGELQPGGTQYDTMYNNLVARASQSGVRLGPKDFANLTTMALQKGWDQSDMVAHIGELANAKNSGFSPGYLIAQFQNPDSVLPGGTYYEGYRTAVRLAEQQTGKMLTPDELKTAVQLAAEKNWSTDDVVTHMPALTAHAKGLTFNTQYLTNLFENPEHFAWKGNTATGDLSKVAYNQVVTAARKSGIQLNPSQLKSITQMYYEQGWDPTTLGNQIGKLAPYTADHDVSGDYLTGVLLNPTWYQPGGYMWNQNYAAIQAAEPGGGVFFNPTELNALTKTSLLQNWTPDQIATHIGDAERNGKGHAYNPGYVTALINSPDQLSFDPRYGDTTARQMMTSVAEAFRQQGIKPPPNAILQKLATQSLQYGGMSGVGTDVLNQWASAYSTGSTTFDKGYLDMLANTPGQLDFSRPGAKGTAPPENTEADKALVNVEVTAGGMNVNLTQAQAETLAMQSIEGGWDDQALKDQISRYIYYNNPVPAQPRYVVAPGRMGITTGDQLPQKQVQVGTTPPVPATNAPALEQQLQTQAAQYFQQLSPQALQQWMRQIASGTQSTALLNDFLKNEALARWKDPSMQNLLQEGQTPAQIANSLTQLASTTLEIDPTQVDYTRNPVFAKMLDGGYDLGKNGEKVGNGNMMTYSQAGEYLRSLPQYARTTQARSQASDLTQQILATFGKVG